MKNYIINQMQTKPFGGTIGISVILLSAMLMLLSCNEVPKQDVQLKTQLDSTIKEIDSIVQTHKTNPVNSTVDADTVEEPEPRFQTIRAIYDHNDVEEIRGELHEMGLEIDDSTGMIYKPASTKK